MSVSNVLKLLIITFLLSLAILFLSSCDNTFFDIYTKIETDYSGTRSTEIAVKTEYLQKAEIILSKNESVYDKILTSLPEGKIETFEKEQYTHFKSTVEFSDINFLQHVSIDNYSDTPPERFYAKMERDDYFFNSQYFFYDYVDMRIEDSIIESVGEGGDLSRLADLFSADEELLKITYQVKFPVKIIETNADRIGEDNIAIWELKFGEQENIYIEGKKIKYFSYVLLVIVSLIGLFILFLIFMLIYGRKRRRIKSKTNKPYFSYDNYFKHDNNYNSIDDDEDY